MLTAIAIPVFTAQLEKSREATDQANLRSAYAEQMTNLLTWDGTSTIPTITVTSKQTQANWQSANNAASIRIADGISNSNGQSGFNAAAKTGGTPWTIGVDTTKMEITCS